MRMSAAELGSFQGHEQKSGSLMAPVSSPVLDVMSHPLHIPVSLS